MRRFILAAALAFSAAACGGSPTAPSTTPAPAPPAPAPPPTTVSLAGTVTSQAGSRLGGAVVTFLDGANAGKSTTTASDGTYRFDSVTRGDANVSARATGFEEGRGGLNVNGTDNLNFTLRTAQPWTRSGSSGTGANVNNVFDMPTYITRVRIVGVTKASSTNFVVYVGGRLLVNEVIGTFRNNPRYDGTLITSGGKVQVDLARDVDWSLTEVR